MKDFYDEDFPVQAVGRHLYTRRGFHFCDCQDQMIANEIADRLNRDHERTGGEIGIRAFKEHIKGQTQ